MAGRYGGWLEEQYPITHKLVAAGAHPLLTEARRTEFEPTETMKAQHMRRVLQQKATALGAANDRIAYSLLLAQHDSKEAGREYVVNFVRDFHRWLLGDLRTGKFSTWIGTKPLTYQQSIAAYIKELIDMREAYRKALVHLYHRGPHDVKTAQLYYKYIVMQFGAKRNMAGDPMAFMQLDGILDFLDDWNMMDWEPGRAMDYTVSPPGGRPNPPADDGADYRSGRDAPLARDGPALPSVAAMPAPTLAPVMGHPPVPVAFDPDALAASIARALGDVIAGVRGVAPPGPGPATAAAPGGHPLLAYHGTASPDSTDEELIAQFTETLGGMTEEEVRVVIAAGEQAIADAKAALQGELDEAERREYEEALALYERYHRLGYETLRRAVAARAPPEIVEDDGDGDNDDGEAGSSAVAGAIAAYVQAFRHQQEAQAAEERASIAHRDVRARTNPKASKDEIAAASAAWRDARDATTAAITAADEARRRMKAAKAGDL